jgi:hypothetical protein
MVLLRFLGAGHEPTRRIILMSHSLGAAAIGLLNYPGGSAGFTVGETITPLLTRSQGFHNTPI